MHHVVCVDRAAGALGKPVVSPNNLPPDPGWVAYAGDAACLWKTGTDATSFFHTDYRRAPRHRP